MAVLAFPGRLNAGPEFAAFSGKTFAVHANVGDCI
jgi:hypothetical protein